MVRPIFNPAVVNDDDMVDDEHGTVYDIYFPPPYIWIFGGPPRSIIDMWRVLGLGLTDGGLVVGAIIKPLQT
eukprot:9981678-Lingulodinium_polyedra.AAC.1